MRIRILVIMGYLVRIVILVRMGYLVRMGILVRLGYLVRTGILMKKINNCENRQLSENVIFSENGVVASPIYINIYNFMEALYFDSCFLKNVLLQNFMRYLIKPVIMPLMQYIEQLNFLNKI